MAVILRTIAISMLASGALVRAQGAPAAPPATAGQAAKPPATATPPAAVTPAAAAPPANGNAPATGTSPAAGTVAAPAPEPYAYDPAGRRDPFVSLLARGAEPVPGDRSSGLAGMTTSELMLRGVLQSKGTYVAIVAAPDGKTYRAHVNDRLLDGIIRTVTPQGIVIMQEVNDPLSLVKQREVRKGLRTAEDGK